MTDPIPQRVAERAATRYVENENGCWISTYSTASHGYAQVGWQTNGKVQMTTAHRAAWVYYTGQQPEGTVDHRDHCDRRCVRPDHLRDISNFENARRNRPDADSRIGFCLNGHNSEPVAKMRKGKVWMTCPDCYREQNLRHNSKESTRLRKAEWQRRKRAGA
jgi:hypothetical protein